MANRPSSSFRKPIYMVPGFLLLTPPFISCGVCPQIRDVRKSLEDCCLAVLRASAVKFRESRVSSNSGVRAVLRCGDAYLCLGGGSGVGG